jgi:hypothetical protein
MMIHSTHTTVRRQVETFESSEAHSFTAINKKERSVHHVEGLEFVRSTSTYGMFNAV